jgi:hypothetical protein
MIYSWGMGCSAALSAAPAVLELDGPVAEGGAGHKLKLSRLAQVIEQPPALAGQMGKDGDAVFVDQVEPDQRLPD